MAKRYVEIFSDTGEWRTVSVEETGEKETIQEFPRNRVTLTISDKDVDKWVDEFFDKEENKDKSKGDEEFPLDQIYEFVDGKLDELGILGQMRDYDMELVIETNLENCSGRMNSRRQLKSGKRNMKQQRKRPSLLRRSMLATNITLIPYQDYIKERVADLAWAGSQGSGEHVFHRRPHGQGVIAINPGA